MITIAIADDHPMILNGIRDMLQECNHIRITATYLHGEALLAGLQQDVPDVLILDIQMPGLNGDELVFLIRKQYPALPILILTNFDNTLYVNNLINNGASGYLLKNTDRDTLIRAIAQVHEGKQFLLPEMKEKLEQFRNQLRIKTTARFALTPREKNILQLIAAGHTNKEIAEKLFLSLRTVENYRFNLSLKLEARNTADLLRKALELGLIQE